MGKKIIFYFLGSVTALVLIVFFLLTIAGFENLFKAWAWLVTFMCGGFMVIYLLIRPLDAILVYFTLFPIFQIFNVVRLPIPNSSASFSFGGIIQAIILIFGGLAYLWGHGNPAREIRKVNLFFAAFLLWMFFTIAINVRSLDVFFSVKEAGRILSVYLIFLIAFKYTKGWRDIKKFIIALFASLIIPLVVVVFQIFYGTEYLKFEDYNRVMSTFGNPNTLGMYLILPLFFLLIMALNHKSQPNKNIICWSAFYGILAILFFTYTRASWLAFIVGVIFLSIKKYKKLLPYMIFCIVLLLTIFSLDTLRLTSDSGRISTWLAFIKAGFDNPIFGHGLGSISTISKSVLGYVCSGQNQFILYWVEGGMLGIVLFLGLIWSLYGKCSKLFANLSSRFVEDLAMGYQAQLLAICTIALFESNPLFQNWVWLPAGIFLGASVQESKKFTQDPHNHLTTLRK